MNKKKLREMNKIKRKMQKAKGDKRESLQNQLDSYIKYYNGEGYVIRSSYAIGYYLEKKRA